MKPVPHGEPYAGKLHVRFDEGAGVPHGASRSTLHPRSPKPGYLVTPSGVLKKKPPFSPPVIIKPNIKE